MRCGHSLAWRELVADQQMLHKTEPVTAASLQNVQHHDTASNYRRSSVQLARAGTQGQTDPGGKKEKKSLHLSLI